MVMGTVKDKVLLDLVPEIPPTVGALSGSSDKAQSTSSIRFLGLTAWEISGLYLPRVVNLKRFSPSASLPQQVKPNVFSRGLDRIYWPELL